MNSRLYLVLIALLSITSPGAFAQDVRPADSTPTTNDVIGMFQSQGFSGPFARTKTVAEAHEVCSQYGSGADVYKPSEREIDGDYYASYRTCMTQYVPFKQAGADSGNTCASRTVSWGECSATLPAMSEGGFFGAQNTFNTSEFQGFATFQCAGGEISYVGGGCSATVQACKEGQLVEWPVTSPLWADSDPLTPFVDRFGVVRHDPKGSCIASMPFAASGTLLRTPPTIPEMLEPERFDFAASTVGQRCFNGEFLPEGPQPCTYVPKSCDAMTYTHPNGCTFDISAGAHDEVFNSNNPQPQNSEGSVQAHCWDGEWEIKSASCQLSCEPTIPAHSWESITVPVERSCGHSSITLQGGQRLRPNTMHTVLNTTAGMTGNVDYACDNGTLRINSEKCKPSDCDVNIPANTWGDNGPICSHDFFAASAPFEHGDIETKDYRATNTTPTDISKVSGTIRYQCLFGEVSVVEGGSETFCDIEVTPVGICIDNTAPPTTPPTTPPTVPPGGSVIVPNPGGGDVGICRREGYNYQNGMCCYERLGRENCYLIP